jgi:hypothetical protein
MQSVSRGGRTSPERRPVVQPAFDLCGTLGRGYPRLAQRQLDRTIERSTRAELSQNTEFLAFQAPLSLSVHSLKALAGNQKL